MAQGSNDPPAGPAVEGGAGRRAPLSRQRVISATLSLIDEQGIASASMRTVAQRLGVRAMALYRHVDSREQLFDEVVEMVVNELSDDPLVHDSAADVGWRVYLESLARGVRRFARAHPHAFPLVATRPPAAPWVNPPLRSLRWIEAMLDSLSTAGFDDDQVLLTYRSFNSFLLGYLLLETSAMVIADPLPGDGSFQAGDDSGRHDPVDPTDPVPASLSATRETAERHAIEDVDQAAELVDVGPEFPMIKRLRHGLTEDRYEQEFETGLTALLDRIAYETGQESPPQAASPQTKTQNV